MGSLDRRFKSCVILAFGLGATSATLVAQSQAFKSRVSGVEEGSASESNSAGFTTDEVITKMLERNRLRSEKLHRYSATRIYEIRSSEGKLAAQTVVHVRYEAPDKKTFNKTSEQGSAIVRFLVFDRLLKSEGETSSGREHQDTAITTANYSFSPGGEEDIGPYHCFVFEAIPKRKDKYLFQGRIWVEAKDFAIVKVSGHPAKLPSFWVSRADFVRQYQRIDGFWLPYHDETSVEVRLYGRKIFTVEHRQYAINSESPAQAEGIDARNPG